VTTFPFSELDLRHGLHLDRRWVLRMLGRFRRLGLIGLPLGLVPAPAREGHR
jgi:hypothetical protein